MNLSAKAKQAWAWVAGLLTGPIGIYTPYILQLDFSHIPKEAHGSALLLILGGLGLVNAKRPKDHEDDPQVPVL